MNALRTVLVAVLLSLSTATVAAQVIYSNELSITPSSVKVQLKKGCASDGQSAAEYGGSCCKGLMITPTGTCFKPKPCSRLNEPAIYACCPGLEAINGFCKKKLSDEAKALLGAAARGAASAMPRLPHHTPQSCAPEGVPVANFENGCCQGLVERNGICTYVPPPCITEGSSVNGGGTCCRGLVRSCTCVRPR